MRGVLRFVLLCIKVLLRCCCVAVVFMFVVAVPPPKQKNMFVLCVLCVPCVCVCLSSIGVRPCFCLIAV